MCTNCLATVAPFMLWCAFGLYLIKCHLCCLNPLFAVVVKDAEEVVVKKKHVTSTE